MNDAGKWEDLTLRAASGVGIAAVGLGAIWVGNTPLLLLAMVVTGLMIWELVSMTARAGLIRFSILMGLFAAGIEYVVVVHHSFPFYLPYLTLPPLAAALLAQKDRIYVFVYGVAIMVAGYALVGFRDGYGLPWVFWLVLLVIVTDLMGYFGGRMLGGPKFWPRISPKKTWSGTIAGWIGAALVGLGFVLWGGAPIWLVALSVLAAFASQMGDIAESALKRRSGVKDSSHILPGHGGVLDRFDGLIGAVGLLLLWGLFLPVPQIGG
jgi:phosphatidate cytidylyltransferase